MFRKNDTLRAAAALGLGVVVHNVSEPPDVDVAIEEMANEGRALFLSCRT
jgi:hypothetical protein